VSARELTIAELYPEHEKQRQVMEAADVIGPFLEWYQSRPRGIENQSIQITLEQYFGLDGRILEAEKRAMLDALRKINEH